MKLKGILAILLVAMLVLAACAEPAAQGGGAAATPPAGQPAAGTATTQDTVTVLGPSMPVSLVPWGANDSASSEMNKQIYSHLFVLDYATFEIVPERGLALSWDQPDASTTNIQIRSGVYFHNGDPLTAHDVAFSLIEGSNSPHTAAFLGMISNVVAHDDYNLTVYTEMPFAPILRHLAHTGAGIVNARVFQELGLEAYADNPIGTGPFAFSNLVLGDRLELTANTNYWGRVPLVTNFVYRAVAAPDVRLVEVASGHADVALQVAPADVAGAEANPDVNLMRRMNLSTNYVGFNVNAPHINNPLVRQAINYAIDTEAIVNHVFMGVGQPINGPLADIAWGFVELEPFTPNLDRARELLAEAGYADGFSTTIWWNIGNPQREQIAEMVQFTLAQLNIQVEVIGMEWASYLEATERGEHDMFILGWVTVTGDADYGLHPPFHSSNFGAGGNRTFWSTPRLDELLDAGRASVDPVERMAIYTEAQEIIRAEAPWVFLNQGEFLIALNPNLRGFEINPAGHHAYAPIWFE